MQLKQIYAHDKVRGIDARMSAIVSADPQGWTISIDSEIDQISSESLLSYWPKFFKPKPRQWMQENIIKADFSKVMFSLSFSQTQKGMKLLGGSGKHLPKLMAQQFGRNPTAP